MNYRIRRTIESYIQANGQQDTRDVIDLFAKRFNTTKQRISGNISCMKCREQSIDIIPRERKIPFSYLHGVNMEQIIRQIYESRK